MDNQDKCFLPEQGRCYATHSTYVQISTTNN